MFWHKKASALQGNAGDICPILTQDPSCTLNPVVSPLVSYQHHNHSIPTQPTKTSNLHRTTKHKMLSIKHYQQIFKPTVNDEELYHSSTGTYSRRDQIVVDCASFFIPIYSQMARKLTLTFVLVETLVSQKIRLMLLPVHGGPYLNIL